MTIGTDRIGLAFILSRLAPISLLAASVTGVACSSAPPELASEGHEQAMTGIEGMLEYSLDAPWRMEPRLNEVLGGVTYGAIPIQMTIDDADRIADDISGFAAPSIGRVCQLDVTEGTTTTTIPVSKFSEIERTRGHWTYPGNEQPNGPPRDVCTATGTSDCASLANVGGTSEWHALAFYSPRSSAPGVDVPLKVQLKVMRGSYTCDDNDLTHSYRMINHLRVHYGEAPLPRFSGGWAYGDLHYHSQGTDNEGESGYNYRGVTRAMEAIGLDFVYATDHASASNQIVDADLSVDKHLLSLKPAQVEAVVKRGVLRDMDARRFRVLSGAVADTNRQTALRSARVNNRLIPRPPTPQIFLGGEVDVIPEMRTAVGSYTYGNDQTYVMDNLCGGWHRNAKRASSSDCDSGVFRCAEVSIIGSILGDNISSCDLGELWQQTQSAQGQVEWLLKDVQALNEYDFGREHMVYLPDPTTADAFVGSFTGTYGGASRRLVEDRSDGTTTHRGMLPEIEQKRGSVFLAHHMNGSGGPGAEGPDGPPWTASMLDKAWRSSAVLGLEFWNEDGRRSSRITTVSGAMHVDDGYSREISNDIVLSDSIRYALKPSSNGKFELNPFDANGKYDTWGTGIDEMLTNGAVSWDRLNMRGLDPRQTSEISWLPAGAPRKMFMAGGSDAHGDFNYRRTGYMVGNDSVIDMAIGTPRNLVMTGAPNNVVDPSAAPVLGPGQTLAALRAGRFSVTDGPALRIAIDKNNNGVIDDGDTPMGDTTSLATFLATRVPVLVEWASTPEWGQVDRIELTVGVLQSSTGKARLYTGGMGPAAAWMGSPVTESYVSPDGQFKYEHTRNDYWFIGNPNPPIDWVPGEWATMLVDQLAGGSADLAGVRAFNLDLARLTVDSAGTKGDRLFVRAVAIGRPAAQVQDCRSQTSDAARAGRCTRRFAYSNPIWVMRPTLNLPPIDRTLDLVSQ